jgi:hypothetical protein
MTKKIIFYVFKAQFNRLWTKIDTKFIIHTPF